MRVHLEATKGHKMNMLREFPYMLPQDEKSQHYDGFISVCGRWFHLEVILPSSGHLSGATVNCDWPLQQVLHHFQHIIRQRLLQCDSLVSFLKELQSIAERQLEGGDEGVASSSRQCGQLVSQVEQVGWDRVVYIDPSFTQLHLQCTDPGSRHHVIKLWIGSQYPEEPPKFSVELPGKFDLHWSPQSTLSDVYRQFVVAVDMYQEFWDMIGDIDTQTWVLEPEKPNHSSLHRRIAINPSTSIQVTVDPSHPRALPECKFLGSDTAIAPLRSSMNTNFTLWDESLRLLDNLQRLLNVEFPSPSNTAKEEFNTECGICYSYRMEQEIPDEVCNDTRCRQPFHKTCLVEWLRALPSSRQSFNTIFGNCPYCEKPITVKMIVK